MANSSFFNSKVDQTIVRSLTKTALKQLRLGEPPKSDPLGVKQFRYMIILETRMMALLPFHISLWQLLQTDSAEMNDKELKSIEKEAKTSLKEDPDDIRSLKLLSSAYAFRGKLREASNVVKSALLCDKNLAEGWYMLGAAFYGLGRVQESFKSLTKATELDPSDKLLDKFHLQVSMEAKLSK